ncbi:hypothetical protein HNV11_11020 [Spirosoma taeanense]|uniref:Uncharacterized protein n=1 Tax=Spirosoma taeanense TaxID=2735870 RepID=A0A6M5Y7J5_9BACT|nr:hypothetical protein [Spirosoma taeanense]QJW89869.1 hypothetical protein HNV11_11020 [Spirosoma taeanense]
MSYNVQDHGDLLEKEATMLIRSYFPYYESVWSIFIGNKGNESIADLPNYPDEKKRKHFAENSYTVLESFFMTHNILESKILEQSITTFNSYIEFNKAFITAFALLGRIHDTAIKASDALDYDNRKFIESIHKFYEARSIVIHGKKVPLLFDDLGLLKIPFLKTSIISGAAWDDNQYLWNDATDMNIEYASDKLTDFFFQLICLVNNEYAIFYDVIQHKLKAIPTSIKSEHNSQLKVNSEINLKVSGSSSTG